MIRCESRWCAAQQQRKDEEDAETRARGLVAAPGGDRCSQLAHRSLQRPSLSAPSCSRPPATLTHAPRYLRGSEPDALTAWIPIGDISPLGGGLMYLEDSVPLGVEIEHKFIELNKDLPEDEQLNAFNINMLQGGGLTRDCNMFAAQTRRRWLVADYKAGDVVFHHCCMIHCSANNEDPEERIRFATDVRFADKQASFEDRWW